MEVAVVGRCKFPGCVNPRQPRLNRRGAPPAYCADPGHEPDAARRERRRLRQRSTLPSELSSEIPAAAPPEEHHRPSESELGPEPQPDAGIDAGPASSSLELPQPRAALEPSTPPPSGTGEGGASTTTATSTDRGAHLGLGPHGPAEQARRVADQLALAAEAYEQIAASAAATETENVELRERVRDLEQELSASHRDPTPDLDPASGPASDPATESPEA